MAAVDDSDFGWRIQNLKNLTAQQKRIREPNTSNNDDDDSQFVAMVTDDEKETCELSYQHCLESLSLSYFYF